MGTCLSTILGSQVDHCLVKPSSRGYRGDICQPSKVKSNLETACSRRKPQLSRFEDAPLYCILKQKVYTDRPPLVQQQVGAFLQAKSHSSRFIYGLRQLGHVSALNTS